MKVDKNGKEIKIARKFREVETYQFDVKEFHHNPYLEEFVEQMKRLSNRLNEIEDDFDDAWDIKEDFHPAIQQFIFTVEG